MSARSHKGQRPLGVYLPDSAGFETFHPGPNSEPLVAVRQLIGAGAGCLFIWGPSGSGKTHLLQAACRETSLSGATGAYCPLHELAVEHPRLLEGLADGRLVCLDDVDGVAGQREWELALVAQIDRLRHAGGHLLCAGSSAPDGLGLVLPDLVSRLSWGGIHRLRPLNDEDRLAALQLRAAKRGLDMPRPVAAYLLARTPRDMPNLMTMLERLDRASLAAKRRLTVPFVRETLGEWLNRT